MAGQLTLDKYKGFKLSQRVDRINVEKRLFIPLDERWYQLFVSGEKEWEMRGVNGLFNSRSVRKGRTVEIRRGYKDNPIWGIIIDRLIVKSIDEIPKEIYDKTIPPSVQNNPEVIDFVQSYVKKFDKLILFEIRIKKG